MMEPRALEDEAEEMRRTGENDAEVLFHLLHDQRKGDEAYPSTFMLHGMVNSMAAHIPHPDHWKQGFWEWWGKHGPK